MSDPILDVRDFLVELLLESRAVEARNALRKVHKQFNTRMGFPVVACAPDRMALTDRFKAWQKAATMTNDWHSVTCENCKRLTL